MEVQTRDFEGELDYFKSFEAALAHANRNPGVWKISFGVSSGERIRLVKGSTGEWYVDQLLDHHPDYYAHLEITRVLRYYNSATERWICLAFFNNGQAIHFDTGERGAYASTIKIRRLLDLSTPFIWRQLDGTPNLHEMQEI